MGPCGVYGVDIMHDRSAQVVAASRCILLYLHFAYTLFNRPINSQRIQKRLRCCGFSDQPPAHPTYRHRKFRIILCNPSVDRMSVSAPEFLILPIMAGLYNCNQTGLDYYKIRRKDEELEGYGVHNKRALIQRIYAQSVTIFLK